MSFVVIDVSNLAYRALHTTGYLEYQGRPTGTLYGIWQTCLDLQSRFQTHNLAFCFDTRNPLRREVYPKYKAKRKEARELEDEEKKLMRQWMYDQIRELWKLLGQMGCANVFGTKGYEADDLMAAIVRDNPDEDLVLVSSDEDLYQCLGPKVRCYRPTTKTIYTDSTLLKDLGVSPAQYASVKAWAGCTSDNIEGLKGVGEKTAAKFLLGKYSKPERFFGEIEVYNTNINLTKLPYPGTPKCQLQTQEEPLDWCILGRYIGSAECLITGVR